MAVASAPLAGHHGPRQSVRTFQDLKASDAPVISTMSSDQVSSPTELSPSTNAGGTILNASRTAAERPSKGILDNKHEAPFRASRSNSANTGFKAALKATFLPPPTPGKQMKVPKGERLGKSFIRAEPLPEGGKNFEGGEVLSYDPRGSAAGVGDGMVPPETLQPRSPAMGRSASFSDLGYSSDASSAIESEAFDNSSEYSATQGSSSPQAASPDNERGRIGAGSQARRAREGSIASTASSSGRSAIRFCPLPRTGRLKRANSITIGVAARSHLLQSQGTAAPPRQNETPSHVHSSQAWYNDAQQQPAHQGQQQHPHADDVVDVGEEIRKGALKAWKKLRGGTASPDGVKVGATETRKKQYPKEGAPVADPITGDLKVVGSGRDKPDFSEKLAVLKEDVERGDQTPKRASSPDKQLAKLSIHDRSGSETLMDSAEELEAATQHNAQLPPYSAKEQPYGHHPHELEDGPQHDSYHLAEAHDGEGDDGTRTPRSNLQRRSSTGAFLHGLSIKGIQEARRRQFLGLDDEKKGQDDEVSGGYEVRGPSGKAGRTGLAGYGHY